MPWMYCQSQLLRASPWEGSRLRYGPTASPERPPKISRRGKSAPEKLYPKWPCAKRAIIGTCPTPYRRGERNSARRRRPRSYRSVTFSRSTAYFLLCSSRRPSAQRTLGCRSSPDLSAYFYVSPVEDGGDANLATVPTSAIPSISVSLRLVNSLLDLDQTVRSDCCRPRGAS